MKELAYGPDKAVNIIAWPYAFVLFDYRHGRVLGIVSYQWPCDRWVALARASYEGAVFNYGSGELPASLADLIDQTP